MIAIIFKAILFYFLFVFIKNIILGYRTYQQLKQGASQGGQSYGPGASARKYNRSSDDVVEAEYRVIKD